MCVGREGTEEEQRWENEFSLLKRANWEAAPAGMKWKAIRSLPTREAWGRAVQGKEKSGREWGGSRAEEAWKGKELGMRNAWFTKPNPFPQALIKRTTNTHT